MGSGPGDAFATSAGPYVLGALSPAERGEFEEHLGACASCRAAVEELAGLPGLLSRVPADVVAALEEDAPAPLPPRAPDTLLPRLLREVRARRRRRRLVLVGGAAAACLAVLAGAAALDGGGPVRTALPAPSTSPAPSSPAGGAGADGGAGPVQSMEPLVPVPLTATAQLTQVAWGTRVDLVCAYASDTAGRPYPYALVVKDAQGHAERIGTWTAVPGRDARLSGATSLTPELISAVEVQTLEGTALLRLDEQDVRS
ncbi:anti-sigma factor family protein [Kineococcus indalonis]|uniref:anti-sigma factor family protein n=1 Tax=Kineococcus indalonis TaxID=2696566 RepID=UPI0014131EE5|nr:zf-HC2 domain-containing protein [Kineococcus indalonis]NAZ86732.1 anti-sigma factor [Kineococcus indalonis]